MAETVTKLPTSSDRIPVSFQFTDGRSVDEVIVRPLSFLGFAECVTNAHAMSQPKSFEARMRRLRLLRQVQFFSNGSNITLTNEDVLKLPIQGVRTLLNKLDDEKIPSGKIIRSGNGVDGSIVFELGTPIASGQNKVAIKELEFIATTYGDVEDVMAAIDMAQQTKLLLETIAKPLGTSLTALPSWAVSQITMADGFVIMNEVLPHFLGSPEE